MNSKIVLFTVVCFALVFAAAAGGKGKGGPGGHKNMTCLGEPLPEDDTTKANMKACMDANPPKKEGKKGPSGCFAACIMEKDGVITDGKYDVTKAQAKINAKFPEKARAGINADLQKCADSNTGTLSTDDDCKSYDPLSKCIGKAIFSNCHDKAMKGKGGKGKGKGGDDEGSDD